MELAPVSHGWQIVLAFFGYGSYVQLIVLALQRWHFFGRPLSDATPLAFFGYGSYVRIIDLALRRWHFLGRRNVLRDVPRNAQRNVLRNVPRRRWRGKKPPARNRHARKPPFYEAARFRHTRAMAWHLIHKRYFLCPIGNFILYRHNTRGAHQTTSGLV